MANETTSASMTGMRPTKVNPKVIDQVHDNSFAMEFVNWQNGLGFASVSQGAVTSTTAATAVANGATEGDAQTVSEITFAAATYSAAMKAVFVVASILGQLTTPVDVMDLATRTIGIALGNKIDTDVFALASGFATVVGTSGVDLAISDLIAAGFNLRVNAGHRHVDAAWCLHPVQVADINNSALSSNSPWVNRALADFFPEAGAAMQGGNYLGTLQGFPAFTSSLVGTVNGGADRGGMLIVIPSGETGAAIGGDMVALDQRNGGSMTPQQRLADAMGGWSCYAVGEEKDLFGVLVQSDA